MPKLWTATKQSKRRRLAEAQSTVGTALRNGPTRQPCRRDKACYGGADSAQLKYRGKRSFLTAGSTKIVKDATRSEEMRSISCETESDGSDSLLDFFHLEETRKWRSIPGRTTSKKAINEKENNHVTRSIGTTHRLTFQWVLVQQRRRGRASYGFGTDEQREDAGENTGTMNNALEQSGSCW